MPTLSLPDPYVGGPVADADPNETFQERFEGTQRNFDAIARLMVETGGQSIGIRFGSATVTTPGAATSFDVVVDHGLGTTPVACLATSNGAGYYAITFGFTSTQFTIRCAQQDSVSADPGDFTASWLAIG